MTCMQIADSVARVGASFRLAYLHDGQCTFFVVRVDCEMVNCFEIKGHNAKNVHQCVCVAQKAQFVLGENLQAMFCVKVTQTNITINARAQVTTVCAWGFCKQWSSLSMFARYCAPTSLAIKSKVKIAMQMYSA